MRRMKKFCVSLVCLAVLAFGAAPAWAVPAFNEAFKKAYLKDGTPLAEKVAEVKCNVCHKGKEKKDKNEFGVAVGKYLKKGDFAGDDKKYDPKSDEGQKVLAEGLEKALKEKSSKGKTYGELIQANELPGFEAE
jgi:hypothetical protein